MVSGHTSTLAGSVELRRSSVAFDGRQLSYLHAGEGRPVVLVHGGGFDAAALSWWETLPDLATEYAVYALDLPGYGRSEPLPGPPSVAAYGRVIARFLDYLDAGPVALVGLSLGGAAALQTALRRPEQIDRLVLVDSYGLGRRLPGGWLAALSVRIPGLMTLTWSLLSRSRWLTAWALRAIVHPANLSPQLVDEVYAVVRAGPSGSWGVFQRSEVGFGGLRTDLSPGLPDLTVPTLFVHGADDPLVPVGWSVRGSTRVPTGELYIIDRCGHWPPRERPAAFTAILRDFLD